MIITLYVYIDLDKSWFMCKSFFDNDDTDDDNVSGSENGNIITYKWGSMIIIQ